MKTETVDAITAASQKATIGGSIMALFGGITATELAAVGGLVLACAGFLVNLYFQWREDRRKSEEHLLRLAAFDRRIGADDTRPARRAAQSGAEVMNRDVVELVNSDCGHASPVVQVDRAAVGTVPNQRA